MSNTTTSVRQASLQDGIEIARIYNWYIENSTITFEEQAVAGSDMAQRIVVADKTRPWLVMEDEGKIVGFACAVRWKLRSAYRYARETSVYIDRDYIGQGRGVALYESLINELRQTSIHVLIAGIALPNEKSITLHEKLGFKKVGELQEVGFKFEKFLDVGYWQLKL